MSMVLDEWAVFVKKARADCRILWRSYSVDQHIAPLKYLEFHERAWRSRGLPGHQPHLTAPPRPRATAENVRDALALLPDRVATYNSTHLATIPKKGFTIVPRTEFKPAGTLADDFTVLFNNFIHPIGGKDHQGRLESFYEGQAKSYDSFRHRFLHGRVPMIEAMPTPLGGTWVDLGGGTAANLEHLRDNLRIFKKVVVLDLCR